MSKTILCDTSFWIGLFDKSDSHAANSEIIFELVVGAKYQILTPWPVLYEFLNSRFFRRYEWVKQFQELERRRFMTKVSDAPYRESAYNNMFTSSRIHRDLSLVDFVIGEMLIDANLKLSAFATFNNADFEHICQSHGIELLS